MAVVSKVSYEAPMGEAIPAGLTAALAPLPVGVLVLVQATGASAPFCAYLNPALRRMAGLEETQPVAGGELPALLSPENPGRARRMLEDGLDGLPLAPCMLRLQSADGRAYWVRMEARCVEGAAFAPPGTLGCRGRAVPGKLLYCTFTDLTTQVATEADATRQAEYLRSLFDMLPAGIVRFQLEIATHTALCLYANRMARFFDGVNPAAKGNDFFARLQQLVYPEDRARLQGILGQLWAGASQIHFDLRLHAGPQLLWLRGVVRRIRGEQGNVLYQVVYEDVTALRQAITSLAAAEQAGAAKNDFLSKVSHELRTPLDGILGLTTLLKAEPGLAPNARQQLSQIEACGRQLLGLVNDILDLSQLESGGFALHPEWYEYEEFRHGLHHAVQAVYAARKLHLVSDSHPCGLPVLADRARLRQIFFILLCTAAVRTPVGGTVRWSYHGLQRDGRLQVVFSLQDGGAPLAQKDLDTLFRPFAVPSESGTPGTGASLALALALAQAMDGNLQAHNGEEGGLVLDLQLSLPLAPPRKVPQSLAGHTVLVVEDHPVNRMIVGRQLMSKGMRVLTATNGAEGVQVFRHAAPGSIDAVLMDLRMPVMDGFAATRAIRALPRQDAATVPILAMTANDSAQDRAQSAAAGMNAHLAKPLEPALLFHTLEEKLAQCQTKSERTTAAAKAP